MPDHTLRLFAIALLAFGGACDSNTHNAHELRWAPKGLTELSAGPYKIPIPSTWRALSELQDKSMQLADGTVGMTPERLERGALRSNMNFTWAALPAGSELPACGELANAIASGLHLTVSEVATLSIDGDRGCRFRGTNPDATLVQVARFHGDHQLVATWTRMATLGSADADGDRAVWARTLASLHIPQT